MKIGCTTRLGLLWTDAWTFSDPTRIVVANITGQTTGQIGRKITGMCLTLARHRSTG
jgi:hypothetical protein